MSREKTSTGGRITGIMQRNPFNSLEFFLELVIIGY
jgi:hypothetical protein